MQTTLTLLTGLQGDDFGAEETAYLSYVLTEAQTCNVKTACLPWFHNH